MLKLKLRDIRICSPGTATVTAAAPPPQPSGAPQPSQPVPGPLEVSVAAVELGATRADKPSVGGAAPQGPARLASLLSPQTSMLLRQFSAEPLDALGAAAGGISSGGRGADTAGQSVSVSSGRPLTVSLQVSGIEVVVQQPSQQGQGQTATQQQGQHERRPLLSASCPAVMVTGSFGVGARWALRASVYPG